MPEKYKIVQKCAHDYFIMSKHRSDSTKEKRKLKRGKKKCNYSLNMFIVKNNLENNG